MAPGSLNCVVHKSTNRWKVKGLIIKKKKKKHQSSESGAEILSWILRVPFANHGPLGTAVCLSRPSQVVPPAADPPEKAQQPAALLRWLRKAHYLQPLRRIHFISAGRSTISTVAAHFIRLNFHPPPTPPLFLIADKLDVAAASLKQINLTRSRNLLCPCRSRAAMMSLAEGWEWITAATWGEADLRGSNLTDLRIL